MSRLLVCGPNDRKRRVCTTLHGALAAMLATLLVAAASPVASAQTVVAEPEPNNTLFQAAGPLAPSTTYTGTLDTPADVDYFYYVVSPASKGTVNVVSSGGCAPMLDVAPREQLGDGWIPYWPWAGSSSVIDRRPEPYEASAGTLPLRVIVRLTAGVRCVSSTSYTIAVEGPGITTDPAQVSASIGPSADPVPVPAGLDGAWLIGGAAYAAAIDSGDDVDTFRFRVRPAYKAAATLISGAAGCSRPLSFSISKPDATGRRPIDEPSLTPYTNVDAGSLWTLSFAAAADLGPEWQIEVTGGCVGLQYQVRVDRPADILAPPLPVATRPIPTVATRITLRRRGKRYTGRVTSTQPACMKARRITIRKLGRGSHVFAAITTHTNGTFRLRKRTRIGGRIYAVAKRITRPSLACGEARSRTIRG